MAPAAAELARDNVDGDAGDADDDAEIVTIDACVAGSHKFPREVVLQLMECLAAQQQKLDRESWPEHKYVCLVCQNRPARTLEGITRHLEHEANKPIASDRNGHADIGTLLRYGWPVTNWKTGAFGGGGRGSGSGKRASVVPAVKFSRSSGKVVTVRDFAEGD